MAPLLVIKCENHISDHDHGNFADDIVIIVINAEMIATILMTIIVMATFTSPPTSPPWHRGTGGEQLTFIIASPGNNG